MGATTPTQTEHFAHDMWGLLHSQSRDGVRQWMVEDGLDSVLMGQGAFIVTQSAAVGAALGTVMGLAATIPGGGLLLAAMNIVDKVEIATKLAGVVEDFRDNGQIDNWCLVAELVFDFFTERVTNTLATNAPTRRNPADMSSDAPFPSRINRQTDTTMPKRCSFSAETRIETADGEKSIADIQVGDLIAGYNPHDDSVDLFQVTATFAQQHTHTLDITIDGEIIHTTDEHPFLNADGKWVNAQDLQVGDEIVSADGDVGNLVGAGIGGAIGGVGHIIGTAVRNTNAPNPEVNVSKFVDDASHIGGGNPVSRLV